MRTSTRLPAAAPAWVGEALAGADREVAVVHRGTDAVYLDLGGASGVLGVLSASATAVPCGLQVTDPHLPADLLGPQRAVLGEGRVRLGDVEVVAARRVDTSVLHLPEDRWTSARTALDEAAGELLQAVRDELPPAALDDLAAGNADAVPVLLGRGSGLTPVGDDVLCGWLATTVAAGGSLAGVAAAVRDLAPTSTTALSATLLACAARGEVLPEFRLLLRDLSDPAGPDVRPRAEALLRVGHTSGAGLLLGARLALHHLVPRSQ